MNPVERHGAVTVIRPDSPLRADAVEPLRSQAGPLLAGGVPMVVLDLSQTPLIDGAGLEWVLTLDETCSRRGGCLRVCGAGELCRDILRVTGVGKSLQQFDDLTLALGSFA